MLFYFIHPQRRYLKVGTMKKLLCVFVPGVKGTELWCKRCSKRAWPPRFLECPIELAARIISNGFSSRVEDMMNGEEYECLRDHEKIPTRVVGRVKLACGLYTREVYANFLERIEKTARDVEREDGVSLHTMTFPYDWTKSNVESAYGLYYMLAGAAGFYDEFILIGHSMGGLVCRYLLEYILTDSPEAVGSKLTCERLSSKIALFYGIGVPHYGCVKSLHSLVAPDGGAFGELCREIPSLYEMIPFSDLETQIKGLPTDAAGTSGERRRSDLFLHDNGKEITVDPKFWRITGRSNADIRDGHEGNLLNALTSRFPVLRDHGDNLVRALHFHMCLNTDRKPPDCVYMLVNATGVVSPSGIDGLGHLEMRCSKGDGTVCSVVESKKNSRLDNLRSKFKCITDRRHSQGVQTTKTEMREPVFTHNVHVSMLDDVDLIMPFKYFVVSNGSDRNANDIVWNITRTGKNGSGTVSRLFKAVLITPPKVPTLTRSSAFFYTINCGHSYRFKTSNFELCGRRFCIISVTKANGENDNCRDKLIALVVEKIDNRKVNRRWRGCRERSKGSSSNAVTVNFHAGKDYGRTWDGMRVILPGFYRPISAEEIT